MAGSIKSSLFRFAAIASMLAGFAVTAMAGPHSPIFEVTNPAGPLVTLANDSGDLAVVTRYSNLLVQRYDYAGQKMVAQGISRDYPAVALDGQGNLIAVGVHSFGGYQTVEAQRFSRSGNYLGVLRLDADSNTLVNCFFVAGATGNTDLFAVAWLRKRPSQLDYELVIRVSDGEGPLSDPIVVAPSAADGTPGCDIDLAVTSAGTVLVAWDEYRMNGNPDTLRMQQYSVWGVQGFASSVQLGPAERARTPRVSMTNSHDKLVTWAALLPGSSTQYGLYGARFDPTNAQLGPVFTITSTRGTRPSHDSDIANDRRFAVTWVNNDRIVDPAAIPHLRYLEFRTDRSPVGSESGLSGQFADSYADNATMGMDAAGRYLVSWSRTYPATSTTATWARRMGLEGVVGVTALASGVAVGVPTSVAGDTHYYRITVPEGSNALKVWLASQAPTGDANIYLRWGSLPTNSCCDGTLRFVEPGSDQTKIYYDLEPGDWFLAVKVNSAISGVAVGAKPQ